LDQSFYSPTPKSARPLRLSHHRVRYVFFRLAATCRKHVARSKIRIVRMWDSGVLSSEVIVRGVGDRL
jgi:hypothetical protein